MDGYSRRAFVATVVGLAATPKAQDSVQRSDRLFDPTRAGRFRDPTGPRDNDAEIQAIEKQLKCTCGTCGLDVYTCRTTDFVCTVSPAMHREVVTLYESGLTGEAIIADFVRRHGVAVLMAPPKRGFNLAGYLVPGVVIVAAAAVLLVILRRWTRGAAATAPALVTPADPSSATPQELERLRQELERFAD